MYRGQACINAYRPSSRVASVVAGGGPDRYHVSARRNLVPRYLLLAFHYSDPIEAALGDWSVQVARRGEAVSTPRGGRRREARALPSKDPRC